MRVRVGMVGVCVAMLVDTASLFLESFGIRNRTAVFHLDGLREENIVLKMNVLVKVLLQALKSRKQCSIRGAAVLWHRKTACQCSHLVDHLGCLIVIADHYGDRVPRGTEWCRRTRHSKIERAFHQRDVREEHPLFF